MEDTKIEKGKGRNPDAIGVTVIICAAIVMLTCIVACAGVAVTWILNAY